MELLIELLAHWGLPFVFACVLLEQAGVPLPAYPALVLAAALSPDACGLVGVVGVAVAACLLADSAWFWAGRRLGWRVVRLMCALSVTAEACAGTAQAVFGRWGAPSLLVAKFVPGFGGMATALAGSSGVRRRTFGVFDLLGSGLWASSAVAMGAIFSEEARQLLTAAGAWGGAVMTGLAAFAALMIAVLGLRKWRFQRTARLLRITPQALARGLQHGRTIAWIDARPSGAGAAGGIPGAIPLCDVLGRRAAGHMDRSLTLVVYCDCAGDASAVSAAMHLRSAGFTDVRVLAGGVGALPRL